MQTENKMWGGNFSEETNEAVVNFTSSIFIDHHLYPYDIKINITHCTILKELNIITKKEAEQIHLGLKTVLKKIQDKNVQFSNELEDIHTHIEHWLYEEIGEVALKLRSLLSRNDQVATSFRMFVKKTCMDLISGYLWNLNLNIVKMAQENIDAIMPGYTHGQKAQPILFSHHLMAYYEMFKRDAGSFMATFVLTDEMPLGSGAMAGVKNYDRELAAKLLGFKRISRNSIDAVSDRDFFISFLAAANMCAIHMSRLAQDLIFWSSNNFVEISDSFCTGSSIMPQKKNPDVAELVRGKTGHMLGGLVSVITMMKGLPLAYNRDMQEDKQVFLECLSNLEACLLILDKMIPKIKIKNQNMFESTKNGFLNATDLADYFVSKGVPFRKAHQYVGKAVQHCIKKNIELNYMELDALKKIVPSTTEDVYEYIQIENIVDRRNSFGGTATKQVQKAIQTALEELS